MNYFEYLSNISIVDEISKSKTIEVNSINDNFNITSIITDFIVSSKSVFVVLDSLYNAQKYYDKFSLMLNEDQIAFYPSDELITAEILSISDEFKQERLDTIQKLLTGNKVLVVTHTSGLIKKQMSKKNWIDSCIELKIGNDIDRDVLIDSFINLGYQKVHTVEKQSEFCVRGSIIDVYLTEYNFPVRIDFFDNEIDLLKFFDPITQLTTNNVDSIKISPSNEMFLIRKRIGEVVQDINNFTCSQSNLSDKELQRYNQDVEELSNTCNLDLFNRYITFFDRDSSSIINFCEEKSIYFIDRYKIQDNFKRILNDLENYCDGVGGYSIFNLNYFENIDELIGREDIKFLNSISSKQGAINALVTEHSIYSGNLDLLIKDINTYIKNKETTIISLPNESKFDIIKDLFIENNIIYSVDNIVENQVNIITDNVLSFDMPDSKLRIIEESILFKNISKQKGKYKQIIKDSVKVRSFEELNKGDFVVHYNYGIGKYLGLKQRESRGIKRDYVHIIYSGDSSLFIPIEQVSLIYKYSSHETLSPKLTKLGTNQWKKTKENVRNRIKDISDKLIKIYARRRDAVGFACMPDTTEQIEFEAEFPYMETEDQLKAIEDVKKDMESERPMDRLICGDVGYGKTEVAIRAAYKAVLNNKQVAYLAPTTLLSRQHYLTFKARLSKHGVNIELLNRFISPKNQKIILEKLSKGNIDVLIGTHRLLSEDIKYNDLGLLIVDEEQRFGVEHKEKIKEIKVNVDTLALSATPIPRTLQMSIMGIKDLSVINTPPANRYPIQTYVLERNQTIIKEAIEKELARNGQVFYLYNRVEDIDLTAQKINNIVPDAKIVTAHGRMPKRKLEDTVKSFEDKEYNVMVCTSIIETGIDIPNVNTIIIHDADMLGLSQLYQVRGRVGRSDRIAYAYLMYNRAKKLNEEAVQRLKAIKEFTELGSGYKIAMRDMAIRGAGDVLGKEQSGFIDSVGVELYSKLLDEYVSGKKIEGKDEISKKEHIVSNRSIDSDYIDNDEVKLEIHKLIDSINNYSDYENTKRVLEDRFGKITSSIEQYMKEKLFSNLCSLEHIENVETKDSFISVSINRDYNTKINGEQLFEFINSLDENIKLHSRNNQIIIEAEKTTKPEIDLISKIIDTI